ncbi:hypothetical protein RI129_011429 [Pyrocoelia pectoralis]|uniref:Cytochrome P450 n=1 Tax=Pyrocoelia pectoralis TaxID=417401 RepID=A0AAN7V5H8_9COLE
MLLIFIFLIAILLALLAYADTRKPRNFPPGPKWLPIIGCAWELRDLHKMKGSLAKATQELAVQYGPVVGARVGRERTVFVCELNATKELLCKVELNGRPDDIFSTSRTFGKRRGIIFTDSEFHQVQKRFLQKQLKESSFRKEVMEATLAHTVRVIIDDLKKKIEGDGVNCISSLFPIHILNSLFTLMTGDTCSDQDMEELCSAMAEFSQNIPLTGAMFTHFPFLKYICPDYCGYNTYVNIHKRILTFVSKRLKFLKQTRDSATPCGFIHEYIKMINCAEGRSSFSEDQLLAIVLDLLIAGYDTTCNTLSFVFMYLLLHPEVQRNAQKEMDSVIGRGRLPSLEDRARLPYVESIILESLRMFAGRGFLIPRRAMKDSTLNGYFIPKGTFIQANSGGTLLDEGAGWKNPKTFDPERFMKDGALNIPDNFILFGLGKRRCLGDTLARANIFLIVASLLHIFHFKPAPGSPPALEIVESFTPSLKPSKAFVTLR